MEKCRSIYLKRLTSKNRRQEENFELCGLQFASCDGRTRANQKVGSNWQRRGNAQREDAKNDSEKYA